MKGPEEHSAHLLWGAEVRPVVLGQEDHLEDFQRGLTAVGAVAVLHGAAFPEVAVVEAVAEIVTANKKEDYWVLFFCPPNHENVKHHPQEGLFSHLAHPYCS